MLDKQTYRNVEKKIVNYFKRDKIIGSLRLKIQVLSEQIEEIDNKLKNIDITIPEESISMSYEEKIQTSKDGSSYAEKAAIKITDKLLNEKSRKQNEIADLEEQIRNFIADNVIIEDNITELRVTDFKFLEDKYSKQFPDWLIGQHDHMSQSKVTRKKQRLIENVASWESWQDKIS